MAHECFSDEIAIDFPSVGRVVERMRDAFLGERLDVDVPVRATCPHCGGRGETWTEPCALCDGSGAASLCYPVRVSVPPGVADGARFRFRLTSPDSRPVRVELRIAVRSSAV